MSNDVDSFDCDATITAIILALEELSLRQQRDAQLEREIGRLESKKYRLETRLEATNIKLQQLRRDAIRQESATLREFKREIALLEQDISKSKDDLRALEHQCSQLEAKCGALEKEKGELHRTADELNRRIEEIKLRDSDTAAKGFELRKLLQEVRFEVAQLEQELCELAEVERHARNRVDWLLSERGRWADGACRLEADNNALRPRLFAVAFRRQTLIEARARASCTPARRRDVTERIGPAVADEGFLQRDTLDQRRQQLWDEIVIVRAEYAALLKRAGYRDTKSVRAQTD